ncbi:NACHT domain-containing protein [Lentzea sp. NPDC005914]|uniref:NACHT domain-containing protein n=1 Tax=Lentzea sp. NPDC005914 TaxID=3154572 RepID=UPI0033CFE643
MPDRARRRRIVAAGPSVLLVLTVLIGLVTNILTGGGFSWWLAGGLLGLVALAVAFQVLSGAGGETASAGSERSADRDPVLEAGLRLAETVWRQDEAALDQLVRHPLARYGQDESDQQLHVRWADWQPGGPLPDHRTGFDELLSQRRLVILGAAGAGKSITAMQLTQSLAARAMAGGGCFPVRVNLVDAPPLFEGGGHRDLPRAAGLFDDWLVHKIAQAGVLRALARRLVEDGRIVVVLDGLDEVDAPAAVPQRAMDIIDVLNHPLSGRLGRRPVVLTCQTSRYIDLARGSGEQRTWLADARVIEILPLEPATVIAEIERRFAGALEPWQAVLERLRRQEPGDRFADTLRSPLHLSLLIDLRLAGSPVPDTSEGIEEAIFERYLRTVARRDGRYTPAQVARWLTVVAHHLATRPGRTQVGNSFNVTDLRRAVLGRFVRVVTVLAGFAIAVLVAGQVVVPLVPPELHGNEELYRTIGGFVAFGGVLPMFGNSTAPRLDLRQLRHRHTWTRLLRSVGEWLVAGAAVGAFGGLVFGLLRHSSNLSLAVGYTALEFAAAGTVYGLVRGVDLNPQARGRREFVAQGLVCTAVMLCGATAIGALAGAFFRPDLLGMCAGLGLLAGLGAVGTTVWPTYVVACLIHLLTRNFLFPARPAAFLDWAHTAGLIRATGNDDQFRHRALQDWLLTRAS